MTIYLNIFVCFEGGPQKCCIQTKIYRLYRNMTIYGHF